MSTSQPALARAARVLGDGVRRAVRRAHLELVADAVPRRARPSRPASARGRTPSPTRIPTSGRQPSAAMSRAELHAGEIYVRAPLRTRRVRASAIVSPIPTTFRMRPPFVTRPPVVQRRPGVEDERSRRLGRLDPVDRRARVAALGIVAARRSRPSPRRGPRRSATPARRERSPASSASRSPSSRGSSDCVSGIAEAAVELDHARSVVRAASARRRGAAGTACRAARARASTGRCTVSRISSTSSSETSGSGEYEPMPPVFGPSSPSPIRL